MKQHPYIFVTQQYTTHHLEKISLVHVVIASIEIRINSIRNSQTLVQIYFGTLMNLEYLQLTQVTKLESFVPGTVGVPGGIDGLARASQTGETKLII